MMGNEAASTAGSAATGGRSHRVIKLGIDVHLDRYVAVRLIDGGAPQAAQRFGPAEFMSWVAKQITLADKVFTCYEAGPFGYSRTGSWRSWESPIMSYGRATGTSMARRSRPTNATPRNWPLHLDRYVNGNSGRVLCGTSAQPGARARAEYLAAAGRVSSARSNAWPPKDAAMLSIMASIFKGMVAGRTLEELGSEVAADCVNLLEPLRRLIAALEVELKTRTQEVEAAAPEELPVGLGKLTSEILEREVLIWNRFKNRLQVGSYTGLCPREDSSSDRRFQGSINKHGTAGCGRCWLSACGA